MRYLQPVVFAGQAAGAICVFLAVTTHVLAFLAVAVSGCSRIRGAT